VRLLALGLIAALVALALQPASSALAQQGSFDQIYNPSGGTNVPINILTGTDRVAQTFTAGRTGNLDGVAFFVTRSGSSGSVTVEIQTTSGGLPTGKVLGSSTLHESSIPMVRESSAFLYSPPVPVVTGTQYAFVVSAPNIASGATVRVYGNVPGGYDRGDAYFSSAGSSGPLANNDLTFVTLVTPAATPTPAPTLTFTPTTTPTTTPTPTESAKLTQTPISTATPISAETPTGALLTTATPTAATAAATATPTVAASTPTVTPMIAARVTTATATATAVIVDENDNRSNRDVAYAEGSVLEVGQDEQGAFVVIGSRESQAMVRLQCGSQCPTIRPGDYIQIAGTKESESLFYAYEVRVSGQ
jgi:hypothetical protein